MKSITTKGIICLQDKHHFVYKIAGIEYVEYEDEFKKKNFKYTFIPNYNVIYLLSSDIFQGIPGLKLEKRKEVYERNNIVPVFISERSPSDNRENLKELL